MKNSLTITSTPGPWEVWGEDDLAPDIPCLDVGRGEVGTPTCKSICLVESTLDGVSDKFSLTPEDHANAHLIAAAPDLLVALEDNIKALEELGIATAPFISGAIGSRNPRVCSACAESSHALAKARAAIAKAHKP